MSDADVDAVARSPASSGATTPSDGSWVDVRAASAGAEGDEQPTATTRVSGKARGDDDGEGDASADAGRAGAGVRRGSSRPPAESNPGPRNTPTGDAVAALRSCAARRLRALADYIEHLHEEDEDEEEDRLAKKLARVARSLAADLARAVARAVAEMYVVACRLGFTRRRCPRSGNTLYPGGGEVGVVRRARRRLRTWWNSCAQPSPWNVVAPLLVAALGLAWRRACATGPSQPPPPRCGL